jgi:hypothetical protein
MTPEERFEQIEATLQSVSNRLDILTKIHLDSDREWRERLDRIEAAIAQDGEHIRALAVNAIQDSEHIRALAVNAVNVRNESVERDKRMAEIDRRWTDAVDAIARLARIADRHEERLDDLEGKA